MKSNQSQFKSLKYAVIALFAFSSTNVIADQEFSTLDGIPAQVMSHQDLSNVEGKYYSSWMGGNYYQGGFYNYYPQYTSYPQYSNRQNVPSYCAGCYGSLNGIFGALGMPSLTFLR